ncbi:hypothetical protein AK88_04167 [Plasmodium fragile]|uniref:Inhibitor of growth protein N-terminal histone-binding domain-containing protein n=1 Tax=Plasmodium fragile TaxID=5857 RepID=A0A0D9QKF9_PLAFR|nr:uncharacterized protein AK88_04167 [Plasmodium fragile]KJP86196.1 hypothetical protein AK88_04167 [Plasmodium fragile]
MSDSAQIYMENVLHITGYLHRLLFLMKELDFKEHKINKLIQQKEEIYLAHLNHWSKNKIDRQGTYLTGQSSMQNDDRLLEFENRNCETEGVDLPGKRHVRIKEEEHSGGEEPTAGADPAAEETPHDCHRNEPTDAASESSLKSTSHKAAKHSTSHRRKKADALQGDPPGERKGVKREVQTDDEQKGEAQNVSDMNNHPCGEPTRPPVKDEADLALHNGEDPPNTHPYKKKNSNQYMPSANTDDEGKSQVCTSTQMYTEEECEHLLNEIISDREQCIALLKEKICINNQIAYLIKTDFDRVKSQHDKLFVEMEMNGESPPYLHDTSRNRSAPYDWNDHQDNVNERSGFSHEQLLTHGHGNDMHGNATHANGSHVRTNQSRSTHQLDSCDMNNTKEDDADSSSIKAFGRKHSHRYDEDYNPYTVGKNKKTKKAKKSRGGENTTTNTSTKLKVATDKGASGVEGGGSAGSEGVVQNSSQTGSSKMRIRLLSVKNLPQEVTNQADGTPSEKVACTAVEEAPHMSTSEAKADLAKADLAKATSLEVAKKQGEDHAEQGANPHGEQPNENEHSNEKENH